MARAYVDRVAVRVDDLEAAVRDFSDLFGMEFEVVKRPAVRGIRVAICDQGIELVQQVDPACPVASNWAGNVLAALSVKVPDIAPLEQKLIERGIKVMGKHETSLVKELYCVSATFHGLPLMISQYGDSFVACALDGGEDHHP